MPWHLNQIETFVEVALEGSFTRAADQLGLTQPRVSARILTLERSLGFPLFVRGGRTVALTEAGAVFLTSAKALLEAGRRTAHVARELRGAQTRRLRIGALPVHVWLRWRVLQSFMAQHPHVAIEVEVDTSSDSLARKVARGDLDVAFIHERGSMAEFDKKVLLRARYGLIALSGAYERPPSSIHDLRGSTVGMFRRELHSSLHDEITAVLASTRIETVDLPEVSEEGIQNFVRRMRVPVLSFEMWDEFNKPPDLAFHWVGDFDREITFCAVRLPGSERVTNPLWSHCPNVS